MTVRFGALCLGIDVGASFHVASVMLPTDNPKEWKKLPTLHVTQNREGYDALREWVNRHGIRPVHVALEPTGRMYAETIAAWCRAHGWLVHWVENRALHDYRSMFKSPNKSDEMDTRLLAHYIRHEHATYNTAPEYAATLRQYFQEYQRLQKAKTQYINRLRQLLTVVFPEYELGEGRRKLQLLMEYPGALAIAKASPEDINRIICNKPLTYRLQARASESIGVSFGHYNERTAYTAARILELQNHCASLYTTIEEVVTTHPDWEILSSFPGIAVLTGGTLLATYADINHYPTKQSFKRKLGVAAEDATSGTSVASHTLNRRSSKYARTALHASVIACLGAKTPNAFRAYYEERRNDSTKGHNRRVIARLRGKVAEVLYACLINRTLYEAGRHKSKAELSAELPQMAHGEEQSCDVATA